MSRTNRICLGKLLHQQLPGVTETQRPMATKGRANPNTLTSGRGSFFSLLEQKQIRSCGSDFAIPVRGMWGFRSQVFGNVGCGIFLHTRKKFSRGRGLTNHSVGSWALIPSEREEEKPWDTWAVQCSLALPGSNRDRKSLAKAWQKPGSSLGSHAVQQRAVLSPFEKARKSTASTAFICKCSN